jgi:hypothetical protein
LVELDVAFDSSKVTFAGSLIATVVGAGESFAGGVAGGEEMPASVFATMVSLEFELFLSATAEVGDV